MKNLITFILTLVPSGVAIAIMFAVFSTSYNGNTINDFNTQAEQIIERSGGLSANAKSIIDDMSKKDFKGMFSISSNQQNIPYNKPIIYKISARVPTSSIFTGLNQSSTFEQVYQTYSTSRKGSMFYK